MLDCVSSVLECLETEVIDHAEILFKTLLMLRAAAVENEARCKEVMGNIV